MNMARGSQSLPSVLIDTLVITMWLMFAMMSDHGKIKPVTVVDAVSTPGLTPVDFTAL